MIRGLNPLPEEIDNEKAEGIRTKRKYEEAKRYGSNMCWVPAGSSIVSNNQLARLRNSGLIEKNRRDLFSRDKCTLSKEALTRLAAWNLHNYGGSGEATEMAIAGTMDALFHDNGFDCRSKQLGKSVPSSRTIARYEYILAVDCLIKVLKEI